MINDMLTNHARVLTYAGISLVLALGIAAGGWFFTLDKVGAPLQLPTAERVYELEQGTTLSGMVRELHREGLIESHLWLRIYARLTFNSGQIKKGEYLLREGMTQRELLQLVRAGKVIQRQFTIIEGWKLDQIRAEIALVDELRHVTKGLSDTEIVAHLGIAQSSAEGWFYPDTYAYTKGATDLSLLKQSLSRMQEILDREWSGRQGDLPYQSPYEALVLASVIEKETGMESDRDKIAAVFVRRWQRKIKLQSDPTVIYGMGTHFNGDLRRRDLRMPTAYNTYTNLGLPPTPICSPGQRSIHAALHPANTTSLYFVSRGDGSSQFSDTLEEHNRAVKQFQLENKR
jgi:UPF0755 protein